MRSVFLKIGCLLIAMFWANHALALQIVQLTPQGEAFPVRQVMARFDQDAVRLGDARAPAPLQVRCNPAAAGDGRWLNAREWIFQFHQDLPGGTRCTVRPAPDFVSAQGEHLEAGPHYSFDTGGPALVTAKPSSASEIDAAQYFILQLRAVPDLQSLADHAWCTVEGLGERVPVRRIEGVQRDHALRAVDWEKAAVQAPGRFEVLQCARTLPEGARAELVWGAGMATSSGLSTAKEKRLGYRVRPAFAAEFTCERENAHGACVPNRPLVLHFNAEVSSGLAKRIVLEGPSGRIPPRLGEPDEGNDDAQADSVRTIYFSVSLPELKSFRIVLPPRFADVDGRTLRNAASFPLTVRTTANPPLIKFATAPFGIIERYPEGIGQGPALLPVTLRNVESVLGTSTLPIGQVHDLRSDSDTEIIRWYGLVHEFDQFWVRRSFAQKVLLGPLPPVIKAASGGDNSDALAQRSKDAVESRTVSLLAGRPGVKTVDLPQAGDRYTRPMEVVGIPLQPGFHIVEVSSERLGKALLDPRYGPQRRMTVRTAALVTNLNVSIKLGREGGLAWVTALDTGRPVAGARMQVSDCHGALLQKAVTDRQGIARLPNLPPQAPYCEGHGGDGGYFVSARTRDDMAFAWSAWNDGIETWRFDLPTDSSGSDEPSRVVHTVFDRTLLRAGETVSMKHFLRDETIRALRVPRDLKGLPDTLVITHTGSGQQYTQKLEWHRSPSGGLSAASRFAIPKAAKLGRYRVQLAHGSDDGDAVTDTESSGGFRVEEFRLPVLQGRVTPRVTPLVAPPHIPVDVQVDYVSGGPGARLPVQISALLLPKSVHFPDHEAFAFAPPADGKNPTSGEDQRVILDKHALTLDAQGRAYVDISEMPPVDRPQVLLLEATYPDPNGEVQTISSRHTLWPAAVVAGIRAGSWVSTKEKTSFQTIALDLQGHPLAKVPVEVRAMARIVTTTRKRMVGGFYAYDNQVTHRDLGTVCKGTSDAHGLLQCQARFAQSGEVELIASVRDAQGRTARAATSLWVTGGDTLWFGAHNDDRMDVLAEKKHVRPGETIRLQVRMPFRHAQALVSIEREGILETRVVDIDAGDPVIQLKADPAWAPNVFISVLAMRGRIYDVPWYSFFTWGYKTPVAWWHAFWRDRKDYIPPTALVDLSKPAFRLGATEIHVGRDAYRLQVQVHADRTSYPVRGKALVTVRAQTADGKPAAHADVALAAVDEALLQLMPNESWDLLDAMLREHGWGVETATAQAQLVGRRHFGRKAMPPGGGGGVSNTRAVFDTLLLWKPDLVLDAHGEARIEVPLNDSLTRFRIVAVASLGAERFGTGAASIRSTQDLQILPGLPPLVRDGDHLRMTATLRNTTGRSMHLRVQAEAPELTLTAQELDVPANGTREAAWEVNVPSSAGPWTARDWPWRISAQDSKSRAHDAVEKVVRIHPALPLTVQQATLLQVNGPISLEVQAPAGDLRMASGAPLGGLKIAMQPTLAAGLDGVRDWLERYPYGCLEQKTSIAVGLMDFDRWRKLVDTLPTYLDEDGLAHYFPAEAGSEAHGSDALTAYLLDVGDEAAKLDHRYAIPPDLRKRMEDGLIAFVSGKIERRFWSPRKDLELRKLAAIEALARGGRATPGMLQSIAIDPGSWPMGSLLDWMSILQRMPELPRRTPQLAQLRDLAGSRLSYQGTRLVLNDGDEAWWLMRNGDVDAARLLLLAMNDPAWKDDIPRLVQGFLGRQQRGNWLTTSANLWGSLALRRFAQTYEKARVDGITMAQMDGARATVEWSRAPRESAADAEGRRHAATLLGAPQAAENWRAATMFLPWKNPRPQTLALHHQGNGAPWAIVQSWAAVPLTRPFDGGYVVRKTVTAVERAVPDRWSQGDVVRVRLDVAAASDMSWVVISDPIPAGATILGNGLGRDSLVATRGEQSERGTWDALPAYVERSSEAYRSYYEFLPKGALHLEYTLRMNSSGQFHLPPTRVEAMYAPETFGAVPNAVWTVAPRP